MQTADTSVVEGESSLMGAVSDDADAVKADVNAAETSESAAVVPDEKPAAETAN